MDSLTYQFLPEWLYRPLMQGAISLAEAAELWDEWLMQDEPEIFRPASLRLQQAICRVNLLHRPPGSPH